MTKLLVVVGSIRPVRAADLVLPWLASRVNAHGGFEVEIADLRDWALPMFAEHLGTVGDIDDPTCSDPVLRAWNTRVREADAFIVITPEYHHSLPGSLKNAMDSVWPAFGFRNKPVAAVGYSAGIGGGSRAVQHLAQIVIAADAVPLRSTVLLPFVQTAFTTAGEPLDRATDIGLRIMLDDLAWWATALNKARAEGELAPGQTRMMSALTSA
ncbi:NADPH-dependent FMN reductase [Micromonospora sp. NPDC005203]|uniref:NADPH-dependent FMN reductase n=1 Tax=Micromonospora sp. NPDC005203 TaxID=3364226 RepID=UPI00368A1882